MFLMRIGAALYSSINKLIKTTMTGFVKAFSTFKSATYDLKPEKIAILILLQYHLQHHATPKFFKTIGYYVFVRFLFEPIFKKSTEKELNGCRNLILKKIGGK